jgi:hypothetical protein
MRGNDGARQPADDGPAYATAQANGVVAGTLGQGMICYGLL